jgi:steroid delta-isomerase-like uncharacterized protein
VSREENKALARAVVESFNQGNLDVAATYLAGDFTDHSLPPGTTAGRASAQQRWAMLRAALPDARITIDDLVAEGDTVAVRFTLRGTHTGPLMGTAPTGRRVAVTGIDLNRIVDGRIAERWENFDTLGLLQQLGAVAVG